jgi:hypothetical protein
VGEETAKTAILMGVPVRPCLVSFTDLDGFRHTVEVQAESLYEAVVLGVKAFREHGCEPGTASQINIDVRAPSVTHTVSLRTVHEWLDGGARSPKEIIAKKRLKEMLAS